MKPIIYFKRWCDGKGQWICRGRDMVRDLHRMGIGATPNEAYQEWERLNKWA